MIWIYILLILLMIYLIFFFGPATVASFSLFKRFPGIPNEDRKLEGTYAEPHLDKIFKAFAYFRSMGSEEVRIKAYDGIELYGDYYDGGFDKVAICFHGLNSTGLNCFGFEGKFLFEHGYNILLACERGHGKSGGKFTTAGVLEKRDVISWADWAGSQENINSVLFVGTSMGCYAVGAAASELSNNGKIKGMIMNCGYVSVYSQLVNECKMRHIIWPLIVPLMVFWAKACFKIDIKENTLDSLSKSTIPVLFTHGTEDEVVDVGETRKNYAACNAPKEILITEGGHHTIDMIEGWQQAEIALTEFLKKYI